MQPTKQKIFVREVETRNQFEVIGGQIRYSVEAVGKEVSSCKKGDFILFVDSRSYDQNGKKIIVVDEADIEGVECIQK